MHPVIVPNWPAPTWIRALTTTNKSGGVSTGPYEDFNLATHVQDDPLHVAANRLRLRQRLNLSHEPVWLEQTHSTRVEKVSKLTISPIDADGAWTQEKDLPCVVLSADCLPLLLCDTKGTLVAAIHCGWRGIAAGIIENTLNNILPKAQGELMAWMGPAMGPGNFEVGEEVRQQFLQWGLTAAQAFKPLRKADKWAGKWLADIYLLAKQRLQAGGVNAVYGGEYCTYADPQQFYSYRRDGVTGRMATLIWLAPL